ncbi:SDR family NAD(P)-dependent oxidoreductase [Paenibacillus ihuae]|uniref:SDR family NAD(P)-dependent oxidoreductase n=1 Tax=Paenibacillus ihuae TaxID=1232431 RepID=UPI0006D59124|nr:SDR family NAD(P)-dependent oxidoreductase [Paenibacillus ihuae]
MRLEPNVVIGDIACKAELERVHERLVQIRMDMTVSRDAARLMDCAVETFGRIDFLVNNSGTSTMDFAVVVKEADWDKVMDINAKGVYLVSQAGARRCRLAGLLKWRMGLMLFCFSPVPSPLR